MFAQAGIVHVQQVRILILLQSVKVQGVASTECLYRRWPRAATETMLLACLRALSVNQLAISGIAAAFSLVQ